MPQLQLRNSHLWCPRCHKRLAVFALEEEGQRLVPHRCLECPYSEMAPGERPRKTDSPAMADLRRRYWEEVAP